MAQRSGEPIKLRAAGGRFTKAASVEVSDGDLVLYAPDTCAEQVTVPLSSIAYVVDLRERRARRLPASLVGADHIEIAGVGVERPLERATVALVFERPSVLPSPLPGESWSDNARPDDQRWDVIAVDAGRESDHLLSVLARHGAAKSPSLAAAIVTRDGAAAGGQRRSDRTKARDTIVLSTLGLLAFLVAMSVMTAASQSLSWLALALLALPVYLLVVLRATSVPRRRRR